MNRRSEATSSPPAARDLPTGRGTEDQHVVNVSSTRAADTPARLPRLALPQITPPAWDEPTVSEGTRAKNTSVVALLIYSRRAGKRSKKRGTCFATCARHAQGVRAGLSSRRHDEMSFDFFNQNTGPPGGGPALGPNGETSASARHDLFPFSISEGTHGAEVLASNRRVRVFVLALRQPFPSLRSSAGRAVRPHQRRGQNHGPR